jgi:hypothetical protein
MSTTTAGPKGGHRPNTYLAGEAISRGMGVKRGADQNTVVKGTAASVNIGVATDDQDTVGRTISVVDTPGENIEVRAGAAFALDALLTTDAAGKFVTATTGQVVTAVAKQAATALDQLVPAVTVVPARVVAP